MKPRKWAYFYGSAKKHIPASANGSDDKPLCCVAHAVNGHTTTAKDVAERPLCGDCARAARRIAGYLDADR